MPLDLPPALLETFTRFEVFDPSELGMSSRVTARFPASNNANTYTLRDRRVINAPTRGVLSRFAMRMEGSLLFATVEDRLATVVGIVGEGAPRFCLTTMLAGRLCRADGTSVADAGTGHGLIYRGSPGQRFLSSDGNRRLNLWIEAARVERALERLIDAPLRRPLEFAPLVDWSAPRTAALSRLVAQMVGELGHADGLLAAPGTRESMTELLAQAMLLGLSHSHTDALSRPAAGPAPRHLRRAEAFLREAPGPVSLAAVAAAAECSLSTLHAAFRRHRGTTPLAALTEIRLQRARAALLLPGAEPLATLARRMGFSNPSRFTTAYRHRFDETPGETRLRRDG